MLGQVCNVVDWVSLRPRRRSLPVQLRGAVSAVELQCARFAFLILAPLSSFLDSSMFIVKKLEEQRTQGHA